MPKRTHQLHDSLCNLDIYLERETLALPISLVKDILESAEMKKELENIKSHGVRF